MAGPIETKVTASTGAAALAASTSPLFRYTLPLGMRLLLRLPADYWGSHWHRSRCGL